MRRCGPKHSTNLWARKAHGKICVSLLKRQERAVKRWIMCCSLAPPVLAKPRWRKSSHGKWASDSEPRPEIGRASCRESVCQYVSISVGAVSLKKKQRKHYNERTSVAHRGKEQ